MVTTHNFGFPRIGANRELKYALENFWRGKSEREELLSVAREIRQDNWNAQEACDYIPVGDFSLYDQVLDTSFLLGNIPRRVVDQTTDKFEQYFVAARGQAFHASNCTNVRAGEMTKWFDTNYHYIVPEFDRLTEFSFNPEQLLSQLDEAIANNKKVKPTIIGPVSYLWLGKSLDGTNPLSLLNRIIPVYQQLLYRLSAKGVEWIQFDEPVLVSELSEELQKAMQLSYRRLNDTISKLAGLTKGMSPPPIRILLATYFGSLKENLSLACELPVGGIHIDATVAKHE
ncbi:MAG: 5-methyltetrahydropteroyltriglutamate--homocysteine S-methyltransferase, partial [Kangiellaceae bacterium]|nr:5-methyltetrahydropteroyltriglutamate--homocysteine S-methyltransferase [Kangiellaceae bacterium]